MRSKLGTTKTVGMRLRRGYAPPAANAAEVDLRREEADDFAARVPVDKLIFVVHGIGQVSDSHLSCFKCKQSASKVQAQADCADGRCKAHW